MSQTPLLYSEGKWRKPREEAAENLVFKDENMKKMIGKCDYVIKRVNVCNQLKVKTRSKGIEPDPDGGSSHILLQVGRWNLCNVHLPLRLAVQGGQKSELCGILDGFPLQEQLPILHVVCHDAHKASHVLLHHILGSVAVEEERLAPNVV